MGHRVGRELRPGTRLGGAGDPGSRSRSSRPSTRTPTRSAPCATSAPRCASSGEDFDAAKEAALAYAGETGAAFVEDGREPEITEGAGTIALECVEAGVRADTAVVPVGNGALIGGMGLWIREAAPEMSVVGVVARAAPVMRRAFESGDPSPAQAAPATIADGIAVRVPVPEAVPLMRRVVDEVVEVGEGSLREAVRLLHRTLGLVVEPAGAAGIAALLEHPDRFRNREIVTPLCGGNADPALLAAQ